jgi:translation elongation factor EF-4
LVAQIKEVGDVPGGRYDNIRGESCGVALCLAIGPLFQWSIVGCIHWRTAPYGDLRDALEKLKLNDASIAYEPETSACLGIWVQMRFSWSAPYGDSPGEAGTGIQS